jgi:hypothetical protein
MEDNEEEEDDDNYPEFPEYDDTFMREAEGDAEGGSEWEAEGEAHDEPPDDLVGPLLMHGENTKLIRRGRSWIAC